MPTFHHPPATLMAPVHGVERRLMRGLEYVKRINMVLRSFHFTVTLFPSLIVAFRLPKFKLVDYYF